MTTNRPPAPEMIPYLAANRLSLVLLPTEACNFRCVYCYEDFRHGRMGRSVVEGLKRWLTRRAEELDFLSLGWFGGEPLLARGVVEDVMDHVFMLGKRHPPLHLSTGMTTNGYLLTREVFKGLLSRGVTDYQISFDGPRSFHDRKRVLADGRATFDRLWENVSSMQSVEGEFLVDIRVHVDQENHGAIPEFIRMFAEAFADDPRFRLFIRALSQFGGPNDENVQVLGGGLEDPRILSLRELAASLRITIHTELDNGPVCYAAWANSFIVRADGRINKCSLALERPENQVGRITEEGLLELDQDLSMTWIRGLFSGEKEALACPLTGFPDTGEIHCVKKAVKAAATD